MIDNTACRERMIDERSFKALVDVGALTEARAGRVLLRLPGFHRVQRPSAIFSRAALERTRARDRPRLDRDHDRVVLTNDLDFSAILAATGGEKPSVVQIRGDLLTPSAMGRTLCAALARLQRELEAGEILTLDVRKPRVRILPLGSRMADGAETP